jgi:hypothetical protein
MKEKVIADLEAYQDWSNFSEIGRVVNFVFQEIERDRFK